MKPANLVVIMSDEHTGGLTGIDGHPFVRTPHLDALAQRGTRFSKAYTSSPICVPARASFATGRPVHEIGYWDNANAYDGRVPGWGHALQEAGCRVESIGKLHYRSSADPTGFDAQHMPMHIAGGHGMVWGLQRDPLPVFRTQAYGMLQPIGPGNSKYNQYDAAVADRAVAWLEDAASRAEDDRPWVLFVGFVAPHFPLTVPPEWLALYPPETIPLPRLHPTAGYRRHPWAEDMHLSQPVDDSLSDDERRLAVACYYGLISYLDHQIGRIVSALDSTGLSGTTRVAYTSDHGDNMGIRGLWGKCVFYEESARVPLILAGPEVAPGRVCETPVSLVDGGASILDAAGVAGRLKGSPGRSWFTIAGEPEDSSRTVLAEYHAVGSRTGGYMLRDGRWKYIHYVGQAPELFDLTSDPEELDNLAEDAAHALVLRVFEERLRAMLDPDAVDRRAKADQAAVIERHGGPEAAMLVGAPGATPPPI